MSSTFQLVCHARFVRRAMPFTVLTSCQSKNNCVGDVNGTAEKMESSIPLRMKSELAKTILSSNNASKTTRKAFSANYPESQARCVNGMSFLLLKTSENYAGLFKTKYFKKQ